MSDRIGTYKPEYKMPKYGIDGKLYNRDGIGSFRNIGNDRFVVVPPFLPASFDVEGKIAKLKKEAAENAKSKKSSKKL